MSFRFFLRLRDSLRGFLDWTIFDSLVAACERARDVQRVANLDVESRGCEEDEPQSEFFKIALAHIIDLKDQRAVSNRCGRRKEGVLVARMVSLSPLG